MQYVNPSADPARLAVDGYVEARRGY